MYSQLFSLDVKAGQVRGAVRCFIRAASSSRNDDDDASYLQETTGVVLLDDLQAVLHQPRGLTQLHRTVGDLIPNHLDDGREERLIKTYITTTTTTGVWKIIMLIFSVITLEWNTNKNPQRCFNKVCERWRV